MSAGVEGVIGQRSGFLKQGSENVKTGTMSAHRQLERLIKAVCSVPVFLYVMFVADFLAIQLGKLSLHLMLERSTACCKASA